MASTAQGERLAKELSEILETLTRLVSSLQPAPGATRQRLKIAMPGSMSCFMGPEFLSIAGKLAESVELCAGIAPWEEDVFQAHHFDMLVDSHPFDPEEFAHRAEILLDPYVIITSPKSKGATFEGIIRTEPQIAYAGTAKFGQRAAKIAHKMGAKGNPKYSFDSGQSILRFVQIGYGWAITSMMRLYQSPQPIRDIELHVLDIE
ncbi:hypothetical protein [Sulfitobacter sp. MF3-043]|uniref:hypothetical protein n=1 Tax=Sulfitobacter sediminivivens TaxID=3252902 RepID=UPI0036D9EDE9